MPFVIRNKATGEVIKMRSGKSVWRTAAHAKAAYKTSGCYTMGDSGFLKLYGGFSGGKFDDQDIFELVETKLESQVRLDKAEELLQRAYDKLEDVHAGESKIAQEILEFLEGK